jgi:hypothetical protein
MGHAKPTLRAALENFPTQNKKGFGYARQIEAKKLSRRTIRATPKVGDFHFQQWWPISICDRYFTMLTSRPPGLSNVVAHGFCMRM